VFLDSYLSEDVCENTVIIGGDFNTDLNLNDQASVLVKKIMTAYNLSRCDNDISKLNREDSVFTYCNEAMGHYSCIDYMLLSNENKLINYRVIEPDINLSDHRPICANFIAQSHIACHTENASDSGKNMKTVTQLRWDHADLVKYYHLTGLHVQCLMKEFDCQLISGCSKVDLLNYVYDNLIDILRYCASLSVPERRKNFYKFWWDQELDHLKEEATKSHKLWKTTGRPRNGPCFDKYRSDKLAYKLRIRRSQQDETSEYSNDLHEALVHKEGSNFWSCWRSKFSVKDTKKKVQVDGLTGDTEIADHFASHFQNICSSHLAGDSKQLKNLYEKRRLTYSGTPYTKELAFDADLIDKIISNMKRGKAAGFDGITVEHFLHCHPCLPTFLAKLFNLIMEIGVVPNCFGLSYTIPLLKGTNTGMSKSLTANDFRGISISPALSKVFEHCILVKYKTFFDSSDNQFGFKKSSSCSHAIYSVRQSIDHFTSSGTTVSLCALDLSKAFDKINHFCLFNKLMDRVVPTVLLNVMEHWFQIYVTCVRFGSAVSSFVSLDSGVRQGGVLSPLLFAIYVDDVIRKIENSEFCCKIRFTCVSLIMYADDLLILSPSVTLLQHMVLIVEEEFKQIEMSINPMKSVCIRFGPRYDSLCADITTNNGDTIPWVNSCQYLGIVMSSSRVFKCAFDNVKKSFYKSFNAIFGKIGRFASAEVVIHLLKSKCFPVILYGLNACPVNVTDNNSFEFVIFRTLAKVFKTYSKETIGECRDVFCIQAFNEMIKNSKIKFLSRYAVAENTVCRIFALNAEQELKDLLNVIR
jgi:hypothetical protein